DIYRSRIIEGIIQTPVNAGDPLNTRGSESAPALSGDGFELIFSSDRDAEGRSGTLLYRTTLTPISRVQKALLFLDAIKWWLIGLAAGVGALLAMLIWWLKADNRQQVGLLVRCLMGSGALHALILILMSLWMITAAMVESGGDTMEISIDADSLASEKLAVDIRETVADIKLTPEMVKVDANREPTFLPTITPKDLSPQEIVSPDFQIEDTKIDVETREIPTEETQKHANPDVAMTERVKFEIDVELETKPEAADQAKKIQATEVRAEFEVVQAAPEMTDSTDQAVDKPSAPVNTTPTEPSEMAFKATEVTADPHNATEHKNIPKPDVTAIKPVKLDSPDTQLEQPTEGAKQVKTGVAKVETQVTLASGAPAMSSVVGKPLDNAAPASTTPTKPSEMAFKATEVTTDPHNATEHKNIPKPDVTAIGSVKLDSPDTQLEQPTEGAKQAKTGVAKVETQVTLAGGAPAMSSVVGKPLDNAAPASTTPTKPSGMALKATEVTANPEHKNIPKPDVTAIKPVKLDSPDTQLEQAPEGVKQAKTGVAKVETQVTLASGAPAMSSVVGKPLDNAAPASTTPTEPSEMALKATEVTANPEHKNIPKPDVTAIKPVKLDSPDTQLEQAPEGVKQVKTGVAKVETQVTLASGAPAMSNVVGKPLDGNPAPARSAHRKSTGAAEMEATPLYAAKSLDTVDSPQLIGPGDMISHKMPRLTIAADTDLAAPVDKKSNYELRNPINRKRVLKKLGGSDETERAIRLSLDWFTKIQEPDGSWDAAKYNGSKGHNNAATGLAMLCYFGWGARHTEKGPYQVPITKAVKWLAGQVGPDGDLTAGSSQGMYDQGIATMALAEAYGMTKDPALLDPLRRAVKFIIGAQNKNGGWRYKYGSKDSDTSVLGWQLMALTSARMSGLKVPEDSFVLARKYLDTVSSGKSGGRYSYRTTGRGATPTMTAEGMFCQQIMGMKPDNPQIADSVSLLRINLPQKSKPNYYYWYYGCLSMFQHQGPEWDIWNRQMKKTLLTMQDTKGDYRGTWAPKGMWGAGRGGRIMSTAMATLSLEVYYRYLPMYSRVKLKPTTPKKP
ncbi:MAG: hypothetical protein GY794_19045, partial [bacterium]|nr:hypothetical protein [bacterium]